MLRVDGAGAAEHQAELARPVQRLAAVGAEIARPLAVEDLAQGAQHLRLAVRPHREGRGEVLEAEQAGIADLPQQPSGGPWRALAPRRTREQARQCERRD